VCLIVILYQDTVQMGRTTVNYISSSNVNDLDPNIVSLIQMYDHSVATL
jgi:hypothetical protein